MDAESATNGISAVVGPPPVLRLNDHLAEAVKLEHQLVKVPYEHLKKSMRATTRLVEKEVNAVVAGVTEAVDKEMSKDETVQHLTSLVSRLQGLKRKVCVFVFLFLSPSLPLILLYPHLFPCRLT